jgi:hypothetical protein
MKFLKHDNVSIIATSTGQKPISTSFAPGVWRILGEKLLRIIYAVAIYI